LHKDRTLASMPRPLFCGNSCPWPLLGKMGFLLGIIGGIFSNRSWLLSSDGVHCNAQGQYCLYRSYRGAILKALKLLYPVNPVLYCCFCSILLFLQFVEGLSCHTLIICSIYPLGTWCWYILCLYLLYYYGLERHDCFQMPTLRFQHWVFPAAQGIFMIIMLVIYTYIECVSL
jgi:hypothetical protein